MIISVVLVSILVLFSLAASNLVVSSLRSSANVNRANEAFYAAEGALESGLMANQEKGAGYTTGDTSVEYCDTTVTAGGVTTAATGACPTATVKIQGQVPLSSKIDGKFIVPTPGTGTAGQNCNPLEAVLTPFSYTYYPVVYATHLEGPVTVENVPALDHPCNWNKIKIPLYVTTIATDTNCPADPSGETGVYVCNPKDMGLSSLVIKVRTPCKDGSWMCGATERYDLHNALFSASATTSTEPYGGDDPIVSWQIVGTDATNGASYILQPDYAGDWNKLTTPQQWKDSAAVISESKVNKARISTGNPFMVLSVSNDLYGRSGIETDNSPYNGKTGKIFYFLNNTTSSVWAARTIMKPVLKLSVIHSLDSSASSTTMPEYVPYLEYQVVSAIDTAPPAYPADGAQTITAEGLSGTFKQVLEVKQPQETGLLEYVIQQ